MSGKFNFNFACLAVLAVGLAATFGCSKKAAHPEHASKLFEGRSIRTDYLLDQGKTVIRDEKGAEHSLDGFPAMFTGKIEVTAETHGHERHYSVEVLPLTEEEKAAAAPAAQPAAPAASEYE